MYGRFRNAKSLCSFSHGTLVFDDVACQLNGALLDITLHAHCLLNDRIISSICKEFFMYDKRYAYLSITGLGEHTSL